LFRQFDRAVPLEDLEDRVVILLARLADEVGSPERLIRSARGGRRGPRRRDVARGDGNATLTHVRVGRFRRFRRSFHARPAPSADTGLPPVPPTCRESNLV
jgi:hypothetical protein